MNYQQMLKQLKDAGIIPYHAINLNFTLRNLNKIAFHGTVNETTKHFIVKSMIGKIIHSEGEFFISEFEFRNRVIDLFRIANGGFVKYEIANNIRKESLKEDKEIPGMDILIDLNKVPDDLKKMEKYLKDLII